MKIKYETERLIVREWESKDYLDLFEYASDEEVTKFLVFPTYKTKKEAKERIKYLIEKYKENDKLGDFAIELKGAKKVIGSINLSLH